jgi:uncharacterized protein
MSSADGSAPLDLSRLAIFPLPRAHLFPHAVLPLHVFEPRYRELIADCMARERAFAVALLEPGYEASYEERPAVRAVCGVGRVIAHEPLPDGRSNVILRGVARARIVEELAPDRAYRLVRAVAMPDVVRDGGELAGALHALVVLTDELARKLPAGGETLRALARSQTEPGALADVLAAALVTDPDDRQLLLETVDVRTRVDALNGHLSAVLSRMANRGPAN